MSKLRKRSTKLWNFVSHQKAFDTKCNSEESFSSIGVPGLYTKREPTLTGNPNCKNIAPQYNSISLTNAAQSFDTFSNTPKDSRTTRSRFSEIRQKPKENLNQSCPSLLRESDVKFEEIDKFIQTLTFAVGQCQKRKPSTLSSAFPNYAMTPSLACFNLWRKIKELIEEKWILQDMLDKEHGDGINCNCKISEVARQLEIEKNSANENLFELECLEEENSTLKEEIKYLKGLIRNFSFREHENFQNSVCKTEYDSIVKKLSDKCHDFQTKILDFERENLELKKELDFVDSENAILIKAESEMFQKVEKLVENLKNIDVDL